MPNWCHNALTVAGDAETLADFVARAREKVDDEQLRADYEETVFLGAARQPFDEYVAQRREHRKPLSFDALVPFVAAEWETTYQTCFICGGSGTREDGLERFGPEWVKATDGCNGCHGTGQAVDEEGWRRHHVAEWGTKWDASFDGPGMAVGQEGMDVDASAAAQGAVLTPTVAVYKFDTAWSPPSEFVERASALFPTLEFTLQYAEPGGEFAGRDRYVAGVAVEREELEVEDVLMPEEMWF